MSGIAVGSAVGGSFLVTGVAWLVATYGWRTSVLIIGITIWAIGLPLALVFRRSPEHYGLLPDGDTIPATASDGLASVHSGRTAGETAVG